MVSWGSRSALDYLFRLWEKNTNAKIRCGGRKIYKKTISIREGATGELGENRELCASGRSFTPATIIEIIPKFVVTSNPYILFDTVVDPDPNQIRFPQLGSRSKTGKNRKNLKQKVYRYAVLWSRSNFDRLQVWLPAPVPAPGSGSGSRLWNKKFATQMKRKKFSFEK